MSTGSPEKGKEKLWQIYQWIKEEAATGGRKIAYGMPTFYQNENLIHFDNVKNHIEFYPTPSAIQKFSKVTKDYKTSKGAIQFPADRKLPEELHRKIIAFRAEKDGNK